MSHADARTAPPPDLLRSVRPRRFTPVIAATIATALIAVLVLHAAACSRGKYTKVTRTDGSIVIGTLVSMRPDVIVIQTRAGRVEIPRSDVRSLAEPTIAEITELGGVGAQEGTTADDRTGRDGARGAPSGGGGAGGSAPGGGPGGGPDGGSGAGGQEGATAGNQAGGEGAGRGGEQASGGSNAGVPGAGGNPGRPGTFAKNDAGRGAGGTGASGTPGSSPPGSGAAGHAAGGASGSSGSGSGAAGSSGAGERAAGPGEVAIPAGTAITVAFDAALASDTARVEQDVSATLRSAIVINGARVVPAGARFTGRITDVASARAADGRGRIAIRFHTLTFDTRTIAIDAPAMPIVAEVFTRADKRKVGWGAAAGAVLGGIVSKTKKGLGIGAAAGAGGTAAAVGLRNDVRIAPGTPIRLHLTRHVLVPAQ
jgi:hypothetical protein